MSRYIKGRGTAFNIVITQSLVTLMVGAVGLTINKQLAIALFTGGAISVVANLWLVLIAFSPPLGSSPQKILAAFYVGELGKFFITALLFLLAFKLLALLKHAPYAATMILAYVLVQAIAWLYPLVSRPSGRN
jgi:ATP synthase protein I